MTGTLQSGAIWDFVTVVGRLIDAAGEFPMEDSASGGELRL